MAFSCEDVGSSLYQNDDGLLDVHFPVDSGFAIIPGIGGGLALEDAERAPIWRTYTPTWTNLTINSGKITARYMKVNKLIFYSINIVFASDSSMGSSPYCTPPAPMAPIFSTGTTTTYAPVGLAWLRDASTASYAGVVMQWNDTFLHPVVMRGDLSYTYVSALTASAPFTWTTGDSIAMSGWYKAL